jgi:hypothetical protein
MDHDGILRKMDAGDPHRKGMGGYEA